MFKRISTRIAFCAILLGAILLAVAAWPGISREQDVHDVGFEETFVAPARGRYVVELTPAHTPFDSPSQNPLRGAFALHDLDQSFDLELNVGTPPLFAEFGVSKKTSLRFQHAQYGYLAEDVPDVENLRFIVTAQRPRPFDGHTDMALTGLSLVAASMALLVLAAFGRLVRSWTNAYRAAA